MEPDSIIIGSSPVCLIEAMWQARHGKSVVVIDGASKVGGAWRDIELFGCDRVEISTHIMRHFRRGYRFLSSKLDVELEPMRPEPFWLMPRYRLMPRRTGYARHWNLTLYRTIGQLLTSSGMYRAIREPSARVIRPVLSSLTVFWRYLKRGSLRAYYPVGGAPAFIRQIEKQARDAGVEIHLDARVNRIEAHAADGVVKLHVNKGRTYSCKRLTITRQTEIDEIESGDKPLVVEKNRNDTYHVHMVVGDGEPRRFSLVRFRTDSSLEMISDVSRFSESFAEAYPDKKLLAAWWRPKVPPGSDDVANEFDNLRAEGLISEQSKLEDFSVSTYPATEITENSVQEIRASLGGLVEVLETDNLTENIDQYAGRWSDIRS